MYLWAFTHRCLGQVFLFTCDVCDMRRRSGRGSCRALCNARNSVSHTRVLKTLIGTGLQMNKQKVTKQTRPYGCSRLSIQWSTIARVSNVCGVGPIASRPILPSASASWVITQCLCSGATVSLVGLICQ